MGFFGKDRHGKIETVVKGLKYIWRVENISKAHSIGVLDSDIVPAFTGVDFHFHMTVSAQGEISLYMHYKSSPIPKYTYLLGGPSDCLPRQHTAFRIPEHTERCGHCNVVTLPQLKQVMQPGEDTLVVHFQWDEDNMQLVGSPDREFIAQWTITDITKIRLTPLTSKAFVLNNAIYAMRVDEMGESDVVVFLFAKEGQIVPHSVMCSNSKDTFMAAEPKTENGANILRFPKEMLMGACSALGTLIVTCKFKKENPLSFLNMGSPGSPSATAGGGGGGGGGGAYGQPKEEPKKIDLGGGEKGKLYDVLESDV